MENTEQAPQQKLRTVLLAAPCHDGRIDVYHVAALAETCKLGLANGINVVPLYMSFDSLVQRARNDIVTVAVEIEADDLFFVDTDQDWNPQDFFRMLSHDVSLVAAAVPKKNDIEQYNVKLTGEFKIEENGLVAVDGVGTGMMRIRKDLLKKIYDASSEYKEPHKEKPTKNVFEVKVVDGQLWSEDIVFCQKVRDLGETVYLDPLVNCGHSGPKRWVGNFYNWIKLIQKR